MTERIVLVDASPYIFRAFFSLPGSMVDASGQPVGAVYGFASFLLRLIEERDPSHLGVAFDGSLTTSFRNEIYPPYKAQRELPPAKLEAQLEACREVALAFGAAAWIDDRFEADDLIATACRRLPAAPILVVSSDKDLAQLVDERVSLLDFARGDLYTPREVRGKFGVSPRQIPDLLALAGDAVDNIPGVRGIGKKTGAALLAEFADVETLYERLEEVASLSLRGARSVQRKLAEGREAALLSKRLATVARDAPLNLEIGDLEFLGADRSAVESLFARLGFTGLKERIGRWRDALR